MANTYTPRQPDVPHFCRTCGARFMVRASDARRGRGWYCGPTCRPRKVVRQTPETFWARVVKSDTPDGCWLWAEGVDTRGYGASSYTVTRTQKYTRAHRIAYFLAYGPFDKRLHVLHDCDVKRCVRPSHLHLGTHDDNLREASERRRFPLGERHHETTLTEDDVRTIRRRYAAGGITRLELAREYGICLTTLGNILRRKTWRHVD